MRNLFKNLTLFTYITNGISIRVKHLHFDQALWIFIAFRKSVHTFIIHILYKFNR